MRRDEELGAGGCGLARVSYVGQRPGADDDVGADARTHSTNRARHVRHCVGQLDRADACLGERFRDRYRVVDGR
jgi:hypothetical protein